MTRMASSAEQPARMTLRDQQKLFTRQRLIDAAVDVFDQQGYAATTVDDIVGAVGASRATFYLHFRSKMEIARELLEGPIREALAPLWEDLGALQPQDVTRDVVTSWLERAFDFYHDLRLEIRAVEEAIAVEAEMREEVVHNLDRAVDVVAPLIATAHPDRDPEDVRVRAAMLVWQHERFSYFWVLRGTEFDRAHVLPVFTDVWMEALTGSADVTKSSARRKRAAKKR
jgi:AcrR family transcriptional regulator